MSIKIILPIAVALFSFSASAWDGYNYDAGSYVEIDDGQLVREGEEIEYYDFGSGSYHHGVVEDITTFGNSVEVEIYDHESNEYRVLEMED